MLDLLRLWFVRRLLWRRSDQYNSYNRTSDAMHPNACRFRHLLWRRGAQRRAAAKFYVSVLQENGIQWYRSIRSRQRRAHRHGSRGGLSSLRGTARRRSQSSHRWFCRTFNARTSYRTTRFNIISDILFQCKRKTPFDRMRITNIYSNFLQ